MRARLIEIFDHLIQQKTMIKQILTSLEEKDLKKISQENTARIESFSEFNTYKEMVDVRPSFQNTHTDLQDLHNFIEKIITRSPFSLNLYLNNQQFTAEHFSLLTKLFNANLYFLHFTLPEYKPSLKEGFTEFFNNYLTLNPAPTLKILDLSFGGKLDSNIINELSKFIISPHRPEVLGLNFMGCSLDQSAIECLSNALIASQSKNISLKFDYSSTLSIGLNGNTLAILAYHLSRNRNVIDCDVIHLDASTDNRPNLLTIQKCIERNRLLNTYPPYSAIIKQAYAEIGLGLPAECDSLKNIAGKFALFNPCKGKLENLPLELKEHLDQIRNIYEIAKKPRV